MGIFGEIFKLRDAPVNRTAGSVYSFFLGTVRRETLMTHRMMVDRNEKGELYYEYQMTYELHLYV